MSNGHVTALLTCLPRCFSAQTPLIGFLGRLVRVKAPGAACDHLFPVSGCDGLNSSSPIGGGTVVPSLKRLSYVNVRRFWFIKGERASC